MGCCLPVFEHGESTGQWTQTTNSIILANHRAKHKQTKRRAVKRQTNTHDNTVNSIINSRKQQQHYHIMLRNHHRQKGPVLSQSVARQGGSNRLEVRTKEGRLCVALTAGGFFSFLHNPLHHRKTQLMIKETVCLGQKWTRTTPSRSTSLRLCYVFVLSTHFDLLVSLPRKTRERKK